MSQKPTYASLLRQVEALRLQSEKLMAAERAIGRQNEYLTALHETSLALLDKLDPQELLQTILERAAALAGAAHGYIFLLAGNGDRMEIQVGMGTFSDQPGLTVRRGEGLSGKVWQTGQPMLVDDYQHWPDRLDDAALNPVHSLVGIPLKQDRSIRGVIGLGHLSPDKRFDQESITMLERFAALALLALEKAQLHAAVLKELAERKKAEKRIRQSEQRYRTFLESSPDPIVVYDMEGLATYINPAFEQTFGMSREEVLGKQIDFVPPEAWHATRSAIKAMLGGRKISLFETQRLTREGKKLDVQLSSCLYMNDQGEPIGNIVTLRDITARKKAERALQNYAETQKVLVREVNHRVKNNLSAIIGMLHMEKDRARAQGAVQYLPALQDLIFRIDGLATVHSLLSASGWRPLEIGELCRQVVNAALKGVPLGKRMQVKVMPSKIQIDSNQAHHLTLIINELATNSMKYAFGNRDEAHIAIDFHQHKRSLTIDFRDDGPGYPAMILQDDVKPSSIGFELIRGIVRRSLNGRVDFSNDKGALARIVFDNALN